MSEPAEVVIDGDIVESTAVEPAAPAQPLLRGYFSLYQTPDGGLLLSMRLDGEDADQHLPMPKNMLRMFRMVTGGADPVRLLMESLAQKREPEPEIT